MSKTITVIGGFTKKEKTWFTWGGTEGVSEGWGVGFGVCGGGLERKLKSGDYTFLSRGGYFGEVERW